MAEPLNGQDRKKRKISDLDSRTVVIMLSAAAAAKSLQ